MGNIPLVLGLLSELGFRRVVAIVDGYKAEDGAAIRKRFPQYRAIEIPEGDVRTKPPTPERPGVQGLADSGGSLQPQHREYVRELFEELNRLLA